VCITCVETEFSPFSAFLGGWRGSGGKGPGNDHLLRTLSIHSKTARILCMFWPKICKLSMVRRRGIFARLARKLRHGIFFISPGVRTRR